MDEKTQRRFSESERNKELEEIQGKFYLQVLDSLNTGEGIEGIRKLLNEMPEKYNRLYRGFIEKLRPLFDQYSENAEKLLKERRVPSVLWLVAEQIANYPNMWHNKNENEEERHQAAIEFRETAQLKELATGIYHIEVPQKLFNHIRGENTGNEIDFQIEGKNFSVFLIPDGLDERYRKGIIDHETHHVIFHALRKITSPERGNFVEFGPDIEIQEQAQLAFYSFQDEIIGYLITAIRSKKDILYEQVSDDLVERFIYKQADNPILRSIVHSYLETIYFQLRKNMDRVKTSPFRDFGDLHRYIYPLMAATDFKDMVKRVKEVE